MMALGEMKNQARFPANPTSFDDRFRGTEPEFMRRLNPNLRGQVEDRTKMNEEELLAAETQTRKDRANEEYGNLIKPDKGGIADEAGMKTLSRKTRESIGVAGGSR